MAGGVNWIAQPCGCLHEQFTGIKRPRKCECGYVFESEKSIRARSERPLAPAMKQGKSFAASDPQRDKVKGEPCVGCGRVVEPEESGPWTIDPMHVWPRGKGGCDSPDCVLPGCRNIYSGEGCHRAFDEGKLDLLKRLSDHPEAFAVELAHPIRHHGVTLIELVRRLAGNSHELKWIARHPSPLPEEGTSHAKA